MTEVQKGRTERSDDRKKKRNLDSEIKIKEKKMNVMIKIINETVK